MVPRVAKIGPAKSAARELGDQAAVVDMGVGEQHRGDIGRREGKSAVVQFLQRLGTLEQAAIDQQTPGRRLEQMAGAGHRAGGAAESDANAHGLAPTASLASAPAKMPSNMIALVGCGTLSLDLTLRMPASNSVCTSSGGNSAWVTIASMVAAPAACKRLRAGGERAA